MSTLREDRERAIAVLSDHFAQDHLDVDEFERRLTAAHNAQSGQELVALTRDLPAPPEGALVQVPAPAPALLPAAQVRNKRTLLAILSGAQYTGQWLAPRKLRLITVMGGALLDFREARLPAGVTDVVISAVMGGVQIIVPPGLAVDVAGSAILGGFDHVHRMPAEAGEERPLLRIHGLCVMGGVSIETRLPGESEGDARRRRRHERREQRKQLRDRER